MISRLSPSPAPSPEQLAIIDAARQRHNILVEAIAGSGKTTTILEMARTLPNMSILQVTYNKSLKDEVRQKAKGLDNLLIHTYHSFARACFDVDGYDDHIFDMILSDKMTPKNALAYDIVCLDETQDQTKLYFDFMKYTLGFLPVFPTLIVLGDRYQSIYEFKGTDARFLTFADQIWNRPFVTLPLSTSYRLTHPIASFLNRDVLGENRMQTVKDGPPVCYIRCDPCHISHCTLLLSKMQPYKPHDIFILTPSLKGKHTKWLENILVKQGVPCYYPTSEDTRLDDEIIDGKVVFCTFHQAKGRERKCVIVYHFDLSYFTFYARD
jgi:superfamily I DNA/RNA helicase